jgi:TRAP-type uncharacterized transport system substrate-binding protein
MISDPVDIRICCPGQNWMNIGSLLANGMGGYGSPLPPGSTIAAVTGSTPAALGMAGPQLVAEGRYEFGVTTPSCWLAMACQGLGPYPEPLPLQAIAAFPHDDRLVFAVRRETGLRSLAEIKQRAYPLRLSMPTREEGHPAGWVIDEIFAMYGFSQEDIQAWGGAILRDRPRSQNSPGSVPVDPSFDAVFDEAIMTLRWQRLTTDHDLRFLPLDEDVRRRCAELGLSPGTLRQGRLRGVDGDVPTLDFSGWVLYCAADLPDELAALAVSALDEQQATLSSRFTGPTAAMTSPLDLRRACREVPVELHPGAAARYAELGYLR